MTCILWVYNIENISSNNSINNVELTSWDFKKWKLYGLEKLKLMKYISRWISSWINPYPKEEKHIYSSI